MDAETIDNNIQELLASVRENYPNESALVGVAAATYKEALEPIDASMPAFLQARKKIRKLEAFGDYYVIAAVLLEAQKRPQEMIAHYLGNAKTAYTAAIELTTPARS
ncbi:hypothetical protein C4573_05280 [Candidatus Woesearchaeota archaeon]|nr:MAG: hypothetical protein C4573_05280 [Candidatus Woesearchaeota archaeon]